MHRIKFILLSSPPLASLEVARAAACLMAWLADGYRDMEV